MIPSEVNFSAAGVNGGGYSTKVQENTTGQDNSINLTNAFIKLAATAIFPDRDSMDYILEKDNVEPCENPANEVVGLFLYRQPDQTTTDKKTSTTTKKYINDDGSYTLVKEKDLVYNLLSAVLTGKGEGPIIEEYDKKGNLLKETKYTSGANNSITTTYDEDGNKLASSEIIRDFDKNNTPQNEDATAMVTIKDYDKSGTYTQYDYEEIDGKMQKQDSSFHCAEAILASIFG